MISFIIPIYKAEAYLPACLDSLLAQTFSDFEAILIDDGSPDRSGEICDTYAAKDERFTVIHQPNAGVSAARNAGVSAARGEFVSFVDADDRLAPEFAQTMVAALRKETDADIVFCNYLRISQGGEPLYSSSYSEKLAGLLKNYPDGVFPREDGVLSKLWEAGILSGCPCKLYRRQVLTERFDPTLSYAEDSLFVASVSLNARAIAYVEAPLYLYLYREGSLSTGWWKGLFSQRSRSLTVIAERFGRANCPLTAEAVQKMRDDLNPEEFLAQINDRRRAAELLREYCTLPNYHGMLEVIATTRSRLTYLVYKLRRPFLLRLYLRLVLRGRR